jgi:hypothetical protein
MVTNIFKIGLLITATQFLLASGCRKNKTIPCVFGGYSFAVTSEWAPQRQVYNIGDTVYLTSSFPKFLTDLVNPSLVIDYSNAVAIGGGVGIGYLDTITRNAIPGRNKFDFFSITGIVGERAVAPDQGPAFTYSELSNLYSFKCGFICRQKGIFMFSVSDLKSPGLSGKNCTNAGFTMTVTNNEKHFSLYEYALGFPNDADGMKRGYCFRVQ